MQNKRLQKQKVVIRASSTWLSDMAVRRTNTVCMVALIIVEIDQGGAVSDPTIPRNTVRTGIGSSIGRAQLLKTPRVAPPAPRTMLQTTVSVQYAYRISNGWRRFIDIVPSWKDIDSCILTLYTRADG